MSKEEDLILDAINYAKAHGFNIIRQATFDRTQNPICCNALGAILIKLGKDNMVDTSYDPQWIKLICAYLDKDMLWMFKFVQGFSYGNCLSFTYMDNGKEKTEHDDVSKWANKLALKNCDKNV